MKSLPLLIAIAGIVLLAPAPTQAASCELYDSGIIRSADRSAWGKTVTVGVKKKGKVLRVINANSCTRRDQVKLSSRKRTHRIFVRNMWFEPGGDTGSPEIVVTERIGNRSLKVRVYTLTAGLTLELLAKKTLTVSTGPVTIALDDRLLSVNEKQWKVFSWQGVTRLAQEKNALTFFSLGDSGLIGQPKTDVAEAMNELAGTLSEIDFLSFNGDNFYLPDHITSVDDEDFAENMLDAYGLSNLNVPWLIMLGNHDYDDNDVEDILALEDPEGRWYLPSRYYSYTYPVDSQEPLLEYFALDTEMIDNRDAGYLDQLDWLETELAASNALWKIVGGHHPVYSYGEHGDTATMISDVLPLLKAGDVDMYIAGHDHDKQVIDHPDDGILHVVSGAGSKLRAVTAGDNSLFAESDYGFVQVSIVKEQLWLRFYDEEGNVDFTHTLTK